MAKKSFPQIIFIYEGINRFMSKLKTLIPIHKALKAIWNYLVQKPGKKVFSQVFRKRELKQRIENAHRIRDNISTCDERLCFYWHMLIKFGFQGIHSSSISLVSFPACLESSFKR